jgi:hypothetical protein
VPRPPFACACFLDRPAYWPRGTRRYCRLFVADDSSRPETFRVLPHRHLVSCPTSNVPEISRATTLLRIAPVIGAGMVSPQTKRGMT